MGFTQKAFAERIGVTRLYVILLEKGVRVPSKTLCILFSCMDTTKNEGGE
jgi:DNA-binding XRE family transcriptional regulator